MATDQSDPLQVVHEQRVAELLRPHLAGHPRARPPVEPPPRVRLTPGDPWTWEAPYGDVEDIARWLEPPAPPTGGGVWATLRHLYDTVGPPLDSWSPLSGVRVAPSLRIPGGWDVMIADPTVAYVAVGSA